MECLVKFAALMGMRSLILFLGLVVFLSAAESRQFSSGENRVHLLELYSSEGCSSCPPAEQWLGDLRDLSGLWRDFVPIAFPVDYWDHLGWRDPYSRKEYAARQAAYAAQWRSNNVYTPEFILDGAEWHRARSSSLLATRTSAGVLTIEYSGGGVCRVSFSQMGDFEVHAALLGGGIASSVGGGENRGRQLRHEFVALELKSVLLAGGSAELKLNDPVPAGVTRRALAVWVTRRGELVPIQATGGWLE